VRSTRDYEEDATALTFMIETTDDGHNAGRSIILSAHNQAEKYDELVYSWCRAAGSGKGKTESQSRHQVIM